MRVSVIIPTYKRAKFLIRAVNSVLFQTYENVEVVVVDDNGNGTKNQKAVETLLQKRFGNLEKLVYLKSESNVGGAAARNFGAGKSTGDYLCFLDDDDVFLPNKIKDQLAFMEKHHLDLSFSDIEIHDGRDRLVDRRIHSQYVKDTGNESILKYHLLYHLTPHSTYMFRRDAFFGTAGFRTETASQGFMLMLEAIESGLKIRYFPDVTAIQYIHNQGRFSQNLIHPGRARELYKIKQQYFDRLSKKEIRFIQFRLNAVLGFYYFRNGVPLKGLKHCIFAFLHAPGSFCRHAAELWKRTEYELL